MAMDWQIPRNGFAWLLLAQLAVIAPHTLRLPLWVLFVFLIAGFWRFMVFQGRWSMPRASAKTLMAITCMAGIYFSYRSFLGLEPTVAMLITGFSLKLVEAKQRRDFYLLAFLAYFVVLAAFLFEQGLLLTVYLIFASMVVTSALVALHDHDQDRFEWHSFKKSGLLFAQSLPLMIVLFAVFPRFAPLWQVPMPGHQAATGVSDRMSPGDIGELVKDTRLAFRANFDGPPPDVNALYWRGLVMTVFDGREWRPGFNAARKRDKRREAILASGDEITYRIIQEPSFNPWVFSLAHASTENTDIVETQDFRLQRTLDVSERISYVVKSDLGAILEPELSERRRDYETRIPFGFNPRVREWVDQKKTSLSPEQFVELVLAEFKNKPFIYTLSPVTLGRHSIDEFFFDTQEGFCGHYASSFVFLMRAAGIPARIVTGYLGGEVNPITQSVLVHQFTAHAWAEVWLSKKGWVRVDPTSAVSPERVEQGIEQAVGSDEFLAGAPFSPIRYRHLVWINKIRMQLDALNYFWVSSVINFKGEKQQDFLTHLLGKINPLRIALLLIGVGGVVVIWVMFDVIVQFFHSGYRPEERYYLRACKRLSRLGLERHSGEGAIDFARRVDASQQVSSDLRQLFLSVTRYYVELRYQPVDSTEAKQLKRLLRQDSRKFSQRLLMSN